MPALSPVLSPIIGIGCDVLAGEPPGTHLQLRYSDAVAEAGGVPLLFPAYSSPETARRALLTVDGLVLTGGNDYDPAVYGQAPHPTLNLLHSRRQAGDLLLAHAALETSLPVLGICGGLQLLNLVHGGDLVQDLPELWPGAGAHRGPPGGPPAAHHRIRVEAGTLLARLIGAGETLVNTSHHQAVGRLGRGLRASAHADDKVLEAIEGSTADRFLLGVQWHPERDPVESSRSIFRGLIEAARRQAERRT